MGFTTPLGLLALLAVPAVLALHLFRRRLEERRVAGLFLFGAERLMATSGRRRTRLLRSASLWLELLAALLLGLWLGGAVAGISTRPVHVVVVVDDSASMAATGADGRSAADRARETAAEIVAPLPRDAVATVIATGPRPEVLCGPRTLVQSVAATLDAWQPWHPAHDPEPALTLALEIAGADGRVCFLTDREWPDVPPEVEVRAHGEAHTNAALVTVLRRRVDDGERLFCDVACWGDAVLRGEVRVRFVTEAGERPAGSVAVQLEPGALRHVAMHVPRSTWPWRVELDVPGDPLDVDDGAVLLPEPDRTVAFASELDEAAALPLRLREVADALQDVVLVADPARAHLVFRAATAGAADARHEIVVSRPEGPTDPWIGPYLVERRDPLLDGVALDGVVWTSGRERLAGRPLVLAGSHPLLVDGGAGGALRLAFDLDVSRTNLFTAPDWPILLANVAEHVRATLPGPLASNVQVGRLIRWRRPAGAPPSNVVLIDPDGSTRDGRSRTDLCEWQARRPGIHRVVADGELAAEVAVHFADPAESDLTTGRTFHRPAEPRVQSATDLAEAPGRVEGRILALLLLLAVVADWWVLRRTGGAG